MNTTQLTCFLNVAETLNFARAAEQLNVTQPAVTQQIHSLETELNQQLFRRTTRTVELTQEGLIFLGDAKAMLEIFERVKKRSESTVVDSRKSFIIGCHSNNDLLYLAPLLEEMKNQVPALYPIFRVIPFQHLYQRLSEEAVDVVVAFHEEGIKKAIHYQELAKIPVIGIAKDHLLTKPKEELHLDDLRKIPLIALNPQKCPEEYRRLLHRALENRSPTEIYFCDAVEAAVSLAQAGYGVAVVPDILHSKHPFLQSFPIVDAAPLSYGVYYKSLTGHSLRKIFLNLAKEMFIHLI